MEAPIYCSKYALPAIAIVIAISGCRENVLGEHTRAQCLLGRADEDDDGKINCEDPDCQVFVECRTGDLSDAPSAGSGPASGDCGQCPDGYVCDRGSCTPVGEFAPGRYTLMVEQAWLPASDAAQVCFDTDPRVAAPAIGECRFLPDPYVSARIEHAKGTATALGTTETRTETLMPRFPANAFELELVPADRIVLEVMDRDSPDADDLIFGCTAHRRSPGGTKLDCVPSDTTRVARGEFRVEASLLPR